ncbi:MAG: hypothetical protein QG656_513 [Candidatus Hydrogenedentes bacterium]|nr:hypothetical protein [Candidatus Hydrogenedentota bacterium]
MALAEDVINNLMSSQKIAERAFRGAAIPTVEEFYAMYGKTQCMDILNRAGDIVLPSETWDDFRTMFLAGVRSRTAVFDYRHCLREIHAVIEYVRKVAGPNSPTQADLKEQISQALNRIQDLGKKQVLEN